MGVRLCYVTLHVGLGTFRPVKEDDITEHEMHSEFCMISQETADVINETRKRGGRVVCVGTTSCRTVESWAEEDGTLKGVSWSEAYRAIAEHLRAVLRTHGPDKFAMLASARCTNEENYLAAKLTRAVIGSPNIDHCARL